MNDDMIAAIDAAVEKSGVQYDNRSRWIMRKLTAELERIGVLPTSDEKQSAASPAKAKPLKVVAPSKSVRTARFAPAITHVTRP